MSMASTAQIVSRTLEQNNTVNFDVIFNCLCRDDRRSRMHWWQCFFKECHHQTIAPPSSSTIKHLIDSDARSEQITGRITGRPNNEHTAHSCSLVCWFNLLHGATTDLPILHTLIPRSFISWLISCVHAFYCHLILVLIPNRPIVYSTIWPKYS